MSCALKTSGTRRTALGRLEGEGEGEPLGVAGRGGFADGACGAVGCPGEGNGCGISAAAFGPVSFHAQSVFVVVHQRH